MRIAKPTVAIVIGLCALAGAADAGAAQRLVTPGGSGDCSSLAAACNLVTGINSAPANSEVIIAPGNYTPSVPLANANGNIYVHGTTGAPKPAISSSAAATALSLTNGGGHVADLVIDSGLDESALFMTGSNILIERAELHSDGSTTCNISGSGLVRDSLCVNLKSGGTAFGTSIGGNANMKLRNVTAIASGGGDSVGLQASESGLTLNMDARNVIAFGVGHDVRVRASTAASTTNLTLENSNYVTVETAGSGTNNFTLAGTGSNQTGKPLFTDTTTYRQAPGSPTIDAGAVDAYTGTTDIDGQPRIQGPLPDIGADEAADLTPPEGAIDSHPKPKTKGKTATFTFSSSESGSTFTCQIDKKPAAPCASPLTIKHVKKGRHRLILTAIDPAGNADSTPESFMWKVSKRHNKRHHGGHHHK